MGEKRAKQKLEIARRHTSDVASRSSDFPVSCQVTWPFLLAIPVSFLSLAGSCLAGGGPAWRPACCARGLNGQGLAGGWLASHSTHSQNTHKTHTPPHLERGETGCVPTKPTLPLDADTSGDSEVSFEHTHKSHSPTPLTALPCLAAVYVAGRQATQRDSCLSIHEGR